ncbi:hypothetical protein [Streptomyces griseoaurantiacus]|uniref:hypothetical protein n=1 Tax=Streptomyces griseoaurantiacus TaxID=68213 RepID=UPI0030E05009
MAVSVTLPWMQGMNYGMGVDLLTGQVRGKTVDPGTATGPSGASGQTVTYDVSLLRSAKELTSHLGIDVSVSGHYGLFSAAGKFGYANSVKFNSQATFLVARCTVANAFMQCEDAQVRAGSDGHNLLSSGKQKQFQEAYGDVFVRGMQTGGEYIALISITSSSTEEQNQISTSLRASFGGLLASGSGSVSVDSEVKQKISHNDVRATTFQVGGQGAEQAFTRDVEAVLNRLSVFPSQVQANPVSYDVQCLSYNTLLLPQPPNEIDLEAQRENLEDYEHIRQKLLTMRNDVEFVQEHPSYFRDPPTSSTLNEWQEYLSNEVTQLTRRASQCANDVGRCETFPLTQPPGWVMPERKLETQTAVVVYENVDFQGNSQVLPKGRYDSAMEEILIGSDTISSVKVPVGLVARLYDGPSFEGNYIDLTSDTPQLGPWDGRTSSLMVYRAGAKPPVCVSLFLKPNYLGEAMQLLPDSGGGGGGGGAPGSSVGPMSALVPEGLVLEIETPTELKTFRTDTPQIDINADTYGCSVYSEWSEPTPG